MNKDKMVKLGKYLDSLKDRLNGPVPEKHKGGEKEFKQFLEREIKNTTKAIEAVKGV